MSLPLDRQLTTLIPNSLLSVIDVFPDNEVSVSTTGFEGLYAFNDFISVYKAGVKVRELRPVITKSTVYNTTEKRIYVKRTNWELDNIGVSKITEVFPYTDDRLIGELLTVAGQDWNIRAGNPTFPLDTVFGVEKHVIALVSDDFEDIDKDISALTSDMYTYGNWEFVDTFKLDADNTSATLIVLEIKDEDNPRNLGVSTTLRVEMTPEGSTHTKFAYSDGAGISEIILPLVPGIEYAHIRIKGDAGLDTYNAYLNHSTKASFSGSFSVMGSPAAITRIRLSDTGNDSTRKSWHADYGLVVLGSLLEATVSDTAMAADLFEYVTAPIQSNFKIIFPDIPRKLHTNFLIIGTNRGTITLQTNNVSAPKHLFDELATLVLKNSRNMVHGFNNSVDDDNIHVTQTEQPNINRLSPKHKVIGATAVKGHPDGQGQGVVIYNANSVSWDGNHMIIDDSSSSTRPGWSFPIDGTDWFNMGTWSANLFGRAKLDVSVGHDGILLTAGVSAVNSGEPIPTARSYRFNIEDQGQTGTMDVEFSGPPPDVNTDFRMGEEFDYNIKFIKGSPTAQLYIDGLLIGIADKIEDVTWGIDIFQVRSGSGSGTKGKSYHKDSKLVILEEHTNLILNNIDFEGYGGIEYSLPEGINDWTLEIGSDVEAVPAGFSIRVIARNRYGKFTIKNHIGRATNENFSFNGEPTFVIDSVKKDSIITLVNGEEDGSDFRVIEDQAKSVILFDGSLLGGKNIDIEMSPYQKIKVTAILDTHTGGTMSAEVDFDSPAQASGGLSGYWIGGSVKYIDKDTSPDNVLFVFNFAINTDKDNILFTTAGFYNLDTQIWTSKDNNSDYVITLIEGIH